MLRVNIERMIGELTIAVGLSILFPSKSILWDMADDFLTRPFWSSVIVVSGAFMVFGATTMNRNFRIWMMVLAVLTWGTMLTVYAINLQATPMAFVSIVVLYHLVGRMREIWGQ